MTVDLRSNSLETAALNGSSAYSSISTGISASSSQVLIGEPSGGLADLRSTVRPRGRSCGGFLFQATDEIVEPQLLQRVPHGVQLARAEFDQRLAFPDQLERLVQAGLAGVQATDDLIDPGRGGLVGLGLGLMLRGPLRLRGRRLGIAHRWRIFAGTEPSANRSRTSSASLARSAVGSASACDDSA